MFDCTDSIDDMALLKRGGTCTFSMNRYAPSALEPFLLSFTFGHVRQIDAVASRVLTSLRKRAQLATRRPGECLYVDVDDTIIEAHGHQKQGSGYGYSGARGLNTMLATVSAPEGLMQG